MQKKRERNRKGEEREKEEEREGREGRKRWRQRKREIERGDGRGRRIGRGSERKLRLHSEADMICHSDVSSSISQPPCALPSVRRQRSSPYIWHTRSDLRALSVINEGRAAALAPPPPLARDNRRGFTSDVGPTGLSQRAKNASGGLRRSPIWTWVWGRR